MGPSQNLLSTQCSTTMVSQTARGGERQEKTKTLSECWSKFSEGKIKDPFNTVYPWQNVATFQKQSRLFTVFDTM